MPILLDEKRARQVAAKRGLEVIGLLGILGSAADRGWIDFAATIARLQTTNFWVSPTLIQALLKRYQVDDHT
jgi:predicted nucleic acid-binding protein